MHHLEYGHSRPLGSLTVGFLIAPPLAAMVIAASVNLYWVNEPFMVVRAGDLGVFLGGPAGVLALCVTWVQLARRSRLRWFVLLPVICWFGGCFYFAASNLPAYFREGWNY